MSARGPIYFLVQQYHRETRPFAVPVHLIGRTQLAPWTYVRALAGRQAGQTFSVMRNEVHATPGDARLVRGSREAIAKYGPKQLEEAKAARELRKRIGRHGAWTERQLKNAFQRVLQVAVPVRRKTEHDRAWRYFDRDFERWEMGERGGSLLNVLLIALLDDVLGAASRYKPPVVDEQSEAFTRAQQLRREVNERTVAIGVPAADAPQAWLEIADALEIVEDAFHEAGDEDRAESAASQRKNILTTLRLAYEPRRPR